MGSFSSISVVVPVYNGALTVELLTQRLATVLPSLAGRYELVLVNDGSRDKSWEAIEALAVTNPWVRGIDLMRNYGQHNALLCGIREAKYEVIVTMDDDLQHPPEEIAKLLDKLAEGFDFVYGTPQHEQHGLWRDLASRITKLALRSAIGSEVAGSVSAFRTFRSHVRDAFCDYRGSFVSIDVLLTWATPRFAAVQVRHDPRRSGESNYTFRKLVTHALNMITGFSVSPLQAVSLMGFGCTLFGLLLLAYVIGRFVIEGGSVPGFPFLASAIAVFSGAQMLALGIIGEYLSRMHSCLMDRPTYAIRQQTNMED